MGKFKPQKMDDASGHRTAIVPDWLPILSGRQPHENIASRACRANGTADWLLVATTDGTGYVRSAGGVRRDLRRGDLLLFRPGTPQDYGFADTTATWHNTWVHFRPRPHWIDWLAWPEFDKGVSLLRAQDDFGVIEAELVRLHDVANGPTRLRTDAAMNALERILIVADQVNPRSGSADIDPRIYRALTLIGERIAEPINVADLSKAVGLSRSQFSALFTQQIKVSPQGYIEAVKLDRAGQMLRSPTWTVGQIAAAHGFASVFYFSTRFRKRFGLSPTAYRQTNLRTQQDDPRPS
ncbi:MAG: helix-turn-helix domain-containing protein [Rhodobacterales bacterium]|nr:helix-turn-helix domain-containing protein [Rhodobacterales bacterium]